MVEAISEGSARRFIGVMQDILTTLKDVYGAQTAVLVPGSGTFGMEAVARQFANREKVLIVRNGFFSYRWTQILDMGGLGADAVVCQARQQGSGAQAPWAPCPATPAGRGPCSTCSTPWTPTSRSRSGRSGSRS